uniref:BRCT domain-containing protein n=1 Tax=Kwoniella dejecticola CBS 10117 TaxID=1296121 RepID=A0A1A5ZZX1_9TREE|nr:uncharacterized protein I303_06903 [Kwoniella dejecticola CBS 10117]OBR83338.1 hypothetical protein I303_06903 [Kwoniella dejecticola CBS 10117]
MSVDQVVADELRIVIRHHGGALSAIPDALHVTHIIVLTPHNAPKNMVKYIGDRSSSNFRPRGECIWLQNEIIRFLARLAGPGSNESHPSRKIVVREEWLDLCIEKRRVVDSSESYGGGTHDPNLAKDDNDGDSHSGTHHPSRPYTPSRPVTPALNNFQNPQQAVFEKPKDPRKKLIDRYQPIPAASTSELVASPLSQHVEESVATSGEGSLNPAGLHTNSATNLASSDMELKSESEVVKEERIDDGRPSSFDDAVGETSQRESAIIDQETERQESCRRSERFEDSPPREQSKTPVRDGDIEIDSVLNPEPKAKSNLRVQTHLVPERPPNITETSLHKERNPTGQKNDPSSSSCATFAPHPEKKVFARGIFPLSFCVHGTGTRKRSTEILISNNGGGILASCTYASIYVFPLSQGDSDIRDVGMLKILHHLRNQPGRMAVSEDWVLHCVDQDELLPLEGYLIFPERVYFMTPPASSQG